MVSRIIKIFKYEFLMIFKDEGSRLIMVGAILLYSLFYTVPFSQHAVRNVPIGVIDNDNTSFSKEFIRKLNATEYVKITKMPSNIKEGEYFTDRNIIRGFILIPKGFEKDIKKGKSTYISSYCDSSFLIIYKQIATGLATAVNETATKAEIGALIKSGISENEATAIAMPIEFIQNPLFNPIGSYQNYIYPLILIMILQQTMLIGVGMLNSTLRERINGVKTRMKNGTFITLKEEKVNPYSENSAEIVIGKSLAYVLLYFVYALIYLLIFPECITYKLNFNIIPMILILLPFLFSTAFFGITMVYFCKKRESSFLIIIVSSVPLIFLPGFVWAKEAIPVTLNFCSKLIPFESAADGLIKINQTGANFSDVLQDFYILCCLCFIYFITACLTIKKMKKELNISV